MALHQEGEERERRLGEKIDAGFKGLEDRLCVRMDKQDARIDKQDERIEKLGNYEKLISAIGAVWLAITTGLSLRK